MFSHLHVGTVDASCCSIREPPGRVEHIPLAGTCLELLGICLELFGKCLGIVWTSFGSCRSCKQLKLQLQTIALQLFCIIFMTQKNSNNFLTIFKTIVFYNGFEYFQEVVAVFCVINMMQKVALFAIATSIVCNFLDIVFLLC